jgi:hypothetical protein
VDSSRAVDWSKAGISGGIPARTTQCGSTIAAYGTSASPISASTINAAIAACPSGEFVSLGAGTFYLSDSIAFWTSAATSNVTLRGQGANKTFIVFMAAGSCNGTGSVVCMEGENGGPGYEKDVCNWTAGYAKGTTTLTLTNCGSTTPATGSIANLKVGSLLILDQLDEANDTGGIWNCAANQTCASASQGGEARTDGTCNGTTCIRSQQQGVIVTAISGNTVTISPGLYMPNWNSGQKPQAWFANTYLNNDGIENLSLDMSNVNDHGIDIMNCIGCFVKGVRSTFAGRSHVQLFQAAHAVVRDSYFYQNLSHATVSYGVEMNGAWDSLVENNIFQQVTDSTPSTTGAAEGSVAGYNFGINTVFTLSQGWFQPSLYLHASGDAYNLWEGNIATGFIGDNIHGTHHFETLFRNYLPGWQASCDGASCSAQTVPVQLYAGTRYFNVIGNVLGRSGYHNNYQCVSSSTSTCSSGNTSIYDLGYSGNGGQVNKTLAFYCSSTACGAKSFFDPMVTSSLMRWGNYDTVTGAARWVTSEIPSGLGSYANSVPSSQTLPTSFYLSAKPSWWGSVAWPAIGPDVTNGTVANVAGHAYSNPAMNCYLNVMSGPSDGSGNALSFNADTCYGTAPAAPTNVNVVVQ